MKVLTVGATGKFAGLVVPELKRRGATVRALIRSKSHEQEAREHGADETAIGDLTDAASLREAAKGVEGVFHINPAFAQHEAGLGVAMVEAAKSSGVKKFVFSGVIHPSISKMKNHSEKQPVEEALYESGMTFTILQPAMFMQNLEASWPQILQSGRFALPYSREKKACYVDYRDVAESAAIALTSDRLDNGTFELCAPGMLSRIELAALISQASNRAIEAAELPFDEWAKAAKMPEGPHRNGLKLMYADYDRYGFPGGNALVLRAILEREPSTIQQYFHELANDRSKSKAA